VTSRLGESRLPRRGFLRLSALGAAALAWPGALRAAAAERSLAFVHTHTGESGRVTYWADGEYVPDGLASIDQLLRDHYSGAVRGFDRRLLDLLHQLQLALGSREPYHVISGYRSPETNARLAARSGGVAKHSLHISAQAVDVRLPGCELRALREAALALQGGGVGYYPGPDFVHVDTGRVRWW
jgi:uncharacterized protein YcbK (DUF882 family)